MTATTAQLSKTATRSRLCRAYCPATAARSVGGVSPSWGTMCRLMAYIGPPVLVADVVLWPDRR